ncbi:hypothetical protein EV361DRAFT_915772 [Lentinula raphanica]|nr:hypothetical protein EV361DRAFT_915772 [Lentinula raphanica]
MNPAEPYTVCLYSITSPLMHPFSPSTRRLSPILFVIRARRPLHIYLYLTLSDLCSTIEITNGAVAAAAGALPPSFVSALHNVDCETLTLIQDFLNLQDTAVSLVTHDLQLYLLEMEGGDRMDVDEEAPNNSSVVSTDTQAQLGFEIIYPAGPQPANAIVLPAKTVNGVIHAEYRDISTLNRPALLEICRECQLGLAGKKNELKAKIVHFSENKSDWQSLIPGAQRSHRGIRDLNVITKKRSHDDDASAPSSSKKPKKLKSSVVRRNELLGLPPNAPPGTQLYSTERSKDMRTLDEKDKLLRWADRFCEKNPHIPREEIMRRRRIREEEKAKEKAASASAIMEHMQTLNNRFDNLTAAVQSITAGSAPLSPAVLTQVVSALRGLPLPAAALEPTVSPSSVNAEPLVSSISTLEVAAASSSPNSDNPSTLVSPDKADIIVPPPPSANVNSPDMTQAIEPPSTTTADPSAARPLQVLRIGNGRHVEYDPATVREPPVISFAPIIPRLGRVWDDESANWDPTDCAELLEINGTSIALRYWPDVFSRKEGLTTWSWLKKSWFEWKYVAERYNSGSPEEFWAEFSSNGQRFNWTKISKQLRSIRTVNERKLAAQAKAEYGDRFSKVFVSSQELSPSST